jgi:hypothetical protein
MFVVVLVFSSFDGISCGCCRGKAFCSNECRKGYMEEEIEEAEEELMILDSALNL